MNQSSDSIFEQGLSFTAELALRWHSQDEPHSESSLQQINAAAEQTLRLLSAVEEYHPEVPDEHGSGHELARLEFKVNLLLDLVSHLLAQQQNLPAPSPVRISASGVQWQSDGEAPGAGCVGEVVVYLNPELPRPVRLPAHIHGDQPLQVGAPTVAVFYGLSEPVIDLLEKMIFRRHRRQIAQSRPNRNPA